MGGLQCFPGIPPLRRPQHNPNQSKETLAACNINTSDASESNTILSQLHHWQQKRLKAKIIAIYTILYKAQNPQKSRLGTSPHNDRTRSEMRCPKESGSYSRGCLDPIDEIWTYDVLRYDIWRMIYNAHAVTKLSIPYVYLTPYILKIPNGQDKPWNTRSCLITWSGRLALVVRLTDD